MRDPTVHKYSKQELNKREHLTKAAIQPHAITPRL
jgi:hypothetical protein